MSTEQRTWKVGELAHQTGLTVRALHHYEAKGLLEPTMRSDSGYRLYSSRDVQRLYRVLALRQLGVPLQRIAEIVGGDGDLRELLERQREEVDRQLDLLGTLQRKLSVLMGLLDTGDIQSHRFIETMEAITRMDKYFTPEQQSDLGRRAEAMGPEGLKKAEQDWADLIAEVRAEMAAGTDPSDLRMRPLTDRWRSLVASFTGSDSGIAKGVARRYKDEGWEQPSHGMLDASLMEYMSEAIQHNGGWA